MDWLENIEEEQSEIINRKNAVMVQPVLWLVETDKAPAKSFFLSH